ncbi:uncharacterized protein LOC142611898 [Castanea sativa]|uniref:uncharacterized protein LOC142611898 n=1 Tax=Castanea sativa TaxID=21020 RepID=UPI003F64B6B2
MPLDAPSVVTTKEATCEELENFLIGDDPEKFFQRPVYYVSKSLHEAEVRYLPLEKAILAVVHATRKLPHYFQSRTVVVLTQLPLMSVLRKADCLGRIAKWGTILGAFDIRYMPHTSIKGEVLVNLVAEFAEPSFEESTKGLHMDGKSVGMISCKELPMWKAYVNGVANQRGSSVGLVLKMGGKSIQMFSDSQLVVGQVIGTLKARDPRMQEYLNKVRYLRSKFDSFVPTHVSRSGNTHADSLATFTTSLA